MKLLEDEKGVGKPSVFQKKEFVVGFFIGILLYLFIFGIRVVKVLVRAGWKFDMIRHGLFNTFNNVGFVVTQVLILVFCVAGSIVLYYYYKQGYFFQK